jgi:rSAM/selenodomain-associated transferase 2
VSAIRFSIIVPVFHEKENIGSLIDCLNHLDSNQLSEIIVVDGALEKDTLAAIHRNQVVKISSERGRAKQMNAGASVARGEILIFLHADTELPLQALQKIHSLMEQREYVGGAFDLGIKSDRLIFGVIGTLASWRSRLNRIPFGDQAIFIRRDYFNRIGGYAEIPLMEDMELMRRIKKSGDKIWIFHDRVITSPRRWQSEGVVYCTFRNWTLQALYFLGVPPHQLAKYYKNHTAMINTELKTPAFAVAPARRTRLWQAGLRAGRLNSKLKMEKTQNSE